MRQCPFGLRVAEPRGVTRFWGVPKRPHPRVRRHTHSLGSILVALGPIGADPARSRSPGGLPACDAAQIV